MTISKEVLELRVFQFDCYQYLDVGEISVLSRHCSTMPSSAERVVNNIEESSKFSTFARKGYSFPLSLDPSHFVQQLLTGLTRHYLRSRQNIRKYNRVLCMGAVIAI